jgi:hypothetical protein
VSGVVWAGRRARRTSILVDPEALLENLDLPLWWDGGKHAAKSKKALAEA